MVFSSILFIYYFLPVFLLVYYLLPGKARNAWILAASLIFYAWGAPKFVFILILSTALNFFLVKFMDRQQNAASRRKLLTANVIINLGILFYYKYIVFFFSNINALADYFAFTPVQLPSIVLPIGISFFTFQSITYTVDVYRKASPPQKRLWDYMMYITLFPQMIAGPIVRYNEIAALIVNRKEYETIDNFVNGFIRFIIGLAKKVLLANPMGAYANEIFDGPLQSMNSTALLLGAVTYSFQIYFDFAGYSDMAIGIGRMIGFKIPENFNAPYISRNISEFWRRWHITLGTFMRDYLYIPLGGNRVHSRFRLYFNLWIVFVLSGFWHGADWTFMVWGVYHGFFLILDRIFYDKVSRKLGVFAIAINYAVVLISWVIFRADNIADAGLFIKQLFVYDNYSALSVGREVSLPLLAAAVFALAPANKKLHRFMENMHAVKLSGSAKVIALLLALALLLLTTGSLVKSDFNPFIYFRF